MFAVPGMLVRVYLEQTCAKFARRSRAQPDKSYYMYTYDAEDGEWKDSPRLRYLEFHFKYRIRTHVVLHSAL